MTSPAIVIMPIKLTSKDPNMSFKNLHARGKVSKADPGVVAGELLGQEVNWNARVYT